MHRAVTDGDYAGVLRSIAFTKDTVHKIAVEPPNASGTIERVISASHAARKTLASPAA